ncbi:gamma-glutamylcyclotransferase [Desulfosporosinus sp. I2]|uniref:gamma-glutamylcyclotransferase n=1 Tax=Desulfosporosinus sp. I2 TaxID=1617025 RepID=UPI000A984EDF|nr:gamma-glutamylcyclotransferase [Desulfosporosinus sp. I2]
MKNGFLSQDKCSRCGGPLDARTMSRMNEDILCMDCSELEKSHPRYKEAVEAERKHVKARNYNYPRIVCRKTVSFRMRTICTQVHLE